MRGGKHKKADIRGMMDHVIEGSKRAYAGTDMEDRFVIFHDGLSLWWTPETQEHMAKRGFEHRQMRILGSNVDKVAKHYRIGKKGKLVGDSPELCRALDSHGFADLDASLAFQCAIASALPIDHPLRRFWNMGTTGSLWGAMVKTWLEVAPCSLRVVEDVDHLPVPLDKIIAAEGCVVPDGFLRAGRRARRADGTGECAGKARKRQRKATLVAKKHHPELDEAYAHLMSVESAKSVRPRGAM